MPDSGQLADGTSKPPALAEAGFVFTVRAPIENTAHIMKAILEVTSGFIGNGEYAGISIGGQEHAQSEVVFTLKNNVSHGGLSGHEKVGGLGAELEKRLGALSKDVQIDAIALEPDKVPQRPPLFWKRWVVSLLGVYPLLIIIFYALQPLTRSLPVPVSLFLIALVLTGVNARYVAPYLARRMQYWIAR